VLPATNSIVKLVDATPGLPRKIIVPKVAWPESRRTKEKPVSRIKPSAGKTVLST